MLKNLAKLFFIFLKIGAFTFGGGYAMISLIEVEIVDKQKWLKSEDFVDIIGVVQTIPGALAVNMASFIGYKLFGIPGAISAGLGVITPSFIIILAISVLYNQFKNMELVNKFFMGVRPAVVSLIVVAIIKLSNLIEKNVFNVFIFTGSVIGIVLLDVHPIVIILIAAITGYLTESRRGKRHAKH